MLKPFHAPLVLIAVCSIAAGGSVPAAHAAAATSAALMPAATHPATLITHPAAAPAAVGIPTSARTAPLNTAVPVPTPAELQRWIHALASDQYAVRHGAARKLLAAGDAAIPAMKKALDGLTTPEMRHLLRQNIRRIVNLDYLRGPLITIHIKNVSAETVFQNICRQAGTSATILQQGFLPNVTISDTKTPFWQVMQQMAVLTNVSPLMWYNPAPGLQLGLNGVLNRRDIVSFQGAFAVAAQSITLNRSIALNQPLHPVSKMFNLDMVLLTIPGKTGPLQMQNPDITKAVDNHGNSLVGPAQPIFQPEWFPTQSTSVYNLNLPLQWPHKPGTLITTLKGYVPVLASYHKTTLNLKIKAKGTTHQTLHGVRVSVGHLQKFNGLWQFNITIRLPEAQAAVNTPTPTQQSIINQIQNFNGTIYNKSGTVVNPNGWSSGGNWQQQIVYTIPMQMGIKPARFTESIYTRARHFKIPFDLKNIPMP